MILVSMLLLPAHIYAQQAQQPQQPSAKGTFKLADEMFAQQKYSSAIKEYLRVAYLYNDSELSEEAIYKTGLCLFLQGSYGPFYGIEQWQKVIAKYPNGKWAAEAAKKIKEANTIIHTSLLYNEPPVITIEEQVAGQFVDWGKGHLNNSNQYIEKLNTTVYNGEELKKAYYWFDKVIAEFPKTHLAAAAQFYRGESFFKKTGQPDYKAAIVEYQKVIDNYPEIFWANEAQMKIADTYKDNLVDIKKAIESYQKLVERNGNNPNNYYVLYAKARLEFLGVK